MEQARERPDEVDAWAVDGARLQELRRERGLSQQQLATLSGVRQQHISNMERRYTRARLGTVLRLAQVLDVTPADLVVGRGEHASGLAFVEPPGASGADGTGSGDTERLLRCLAEMERQSARSRRLVEEITRAQLELEEMVTEFGRSIRSRFPSAASGN